MDSKNRNVKARGEERMHKWPGTTTLGELEDSLTMVSSEHALRISHITPHYIQAWVERLAGQYSPRIPRILNVKIDSHVPNITRRYDAVRKGDQVSVFYGVSQAPLTGVGCVD
ncbi:hypothetical protein PM082_021281 [Marasmius tenuissimus]|nr:hypothetical protein PM082_021281 [Marasmius tenuissimus]